MPVRPPLRLAALAGGAFLVLIGVLGFVPGATVHSVLFDVFATSVLLNLLHLGAGLAGLALARTERGAAAWLLAAGTGSLLLWTLGLAGVDGVLPANRADGWLHLALGAALLALGSSPSAAPTGSEPRSPARSRPA